MIYLAGIVVGLLTGWACVTAFLACSDAGWSWSTFWKRRAVYNEIVAAAKDGRLMRTSSFHGLTDYRMLGDVPETSRNVETFGGGTFVQCAGFDWYQPTRLKRALRHRARSAA